MSYPPFKTLKISRGEQADSVLIVELNRPRKHNSFNLELWGELETCFKQINEDTSVRCVVITGTGPNFSAGLDLTEASEITGIDIDDPGRKALATYKVIRRIQLSHEMVRACPYPVIGAFLGVSYGASIDLACMCDIRIAQKGTRFSVAEVRVGVAADVGTLQLIEKIVGNSSWVREVCFTGREWKSEEALAMGFVSQEVDNVKEAALSLAKEISSLSPLAILGTKKYLNEVREDPNVSRNLEHMASWNMSMLQSEDLMKSAAAIMQKGKKPKFSKL